METVYLQQIFKEFIYSTLIWLQIVIKYNLIFLQWFTKDPIACQGHYYKDQLWLHNSIKGEVRLIEQNLFWHIMAIALIKQILKRYLLVIYLFHKKFRILKNLLWIYSCHLNSGQIGFFLLLYEIWFHPIKASKKDICHPGERVPF